MFTGKQKKRYGGVSVLLASRRMSDGWDVSTSAYTNIYKLWIYMLYIWIRTWTVLLYLHARVMESSLSVKILPFKLRLGDLWLPLKQNRDLRKILSHPIASIKLNKTFKCHHLSVLELAKIVPKNREIFIPENYWALSGHTTSLALCLGLLLWLPQFSGQ